SAAHFRMRMRAAAVTRRHDVVGQGEAGVEPRDGRRAYPLRQAGLRVALRIRFFQQDSHGALPNVWPDILSGKTQADALATPRICPGSSDLACGNAMQHLHHIGLAAINALISRTIDDADTGPVPWMENFVDPLHVGAPGSCCPIRQSS